MKKGILLLLAIMMFFLVGCDNSEIKKELIFCIDKVDNNFIEIYQFDDGSKVYSEFTNIEFRINDDEKINLSSALEQKSITIDYIVSKMVFETAANDGGSLLYKFNVGDNELSDTDFYLIRCHTLSGDRNTIIGTGPNIIDQCK